MASPVTLRDLEGFTLKYLARERRQVQRKDGFYEFLTPEEMRGKKLPGRYKAVTFDRSTAIRNAQAEFFALGHPFIDAMFQEIGDYAFGGHTAVRLIEVPEIPRAEARTGVQFNFIVRSRVQREDGDEYLFDLYTIVIRADGTIDDELAAWAASSYSKDGPASPRTLELFQELDGLQIDSAYQLAKQLLERRVQLWDWEEDVDLIGVAKVAALSSQDGLDSAVGQRGVNDALI